MNTAPSFYIAIPANTLLWHAVLFHYYYMYRTLANPIMFCRLSYGRIVFDNISGDFHRSFLNITFQKNPLLQLVFTIVCKGFFI